MTDQMTFTYVIVLSCIHLIIVILYENSTFTSHANVWCFASVSMRTIDCILYAVYIINMTIWQSMLPKHTIIKRKTIFKTPKIGNLVLLLLQILFVFFHELLGNSNIPHIITRTLKCSTYHHKNFKLVRDWMPCKPGKSLTTPIRNVSRCSRYFSGSFYSV